VIAFCSPHDSNAVAKAGCRSFVNSYPTLDISHELVKGNFAAGAPIALRVNLERDVNEEGESHQPDVAPFYPLDKLANRWLV
jgi:pre-mRNA-splicing helicase BRR2